MIAALIAVSVLSGFQRPDPFAVLNDKNQFPIAVWLQDPSNASRYQAAGFNLYVGLWQGPTEAQLKSLKQAKMPVICEMNQVGKNHRNDSTVAGWMHGDEPDNAQPVTDPETSYRSMSIPSLGSTSRMPRIFFGTFQRDLIVCQVG